MPQFTIDVPNELIPVLIRKAGAWNRSAERFLADYITMCLENEEKAPVDKRREALEDILEERDKGPFITVTDMKAYREGVRASVMERVRQRLRA